VQRISLQQADIATDIRKQVNLVNDHDGCVSEHPRILQWFVVPSVVLATMISSTPKIIVCRANEVTNIFDDEKLDVLKFHPLQSILNQLGLKMARAVRYDLDHGNPECGNATGIKVGLHITLDDCDPDLPMEVFERSFKDARLAEPGELTRFTTKSSCSAKRIRFLPAISSFFSSTLRLLSRCSCHSLGSSMSSSSTTCSSVPERPGFFLHHTSDRGSSIVVVKRAGAIVTPHHKRHALNIEPGSIKLGLCGDRHETECERIGNDT